MRTKLGGAALDLTTPLIPPLVEQCPVDSMGSEAKRMAPESPCARSEAVPTVLNRAWLKFFRVELSRDYPGPILDGP